MKAVIAAMAIWMPPNAERTKGRFAAALGASLLFVLLALAIGSLAQRAIEEMRELNTANSDNLQWTLSQTEVEFLQFYGAVVLAKGEPLDDLTAVRRWYDIFVSRMNILSNGPIYGQLAAQDTMQDEFTRIGAYLKRIQPMIDGGDADLRRNLPQIAKEAVALRRDVRNLTLEGIRVFSRMSDNQRLSISQTMGSIAMLTVGLILLLLLAVFFLARIYGLTRRQAMENIATRERLQTMLNTSLDAVLVLDRQGRFLEFNGAATEIFGYTEAEILGQDMSRLILADPALGTSSQELLRRIDAGEGGIIANGRVQWKAKRKSGQVFPVELSLSKSITPAGEIFVSYLRDISDRIQAEDRLTKARDDALAGERAKARFMAVMSHEMRTPLNGLLGSLDLLRGTKLSPKQNEFAEVMQKSGALLLHHVNDVLDIARLESGRMVGDSVALNMDKLVQEVLESQSALARAKGLTLSYLPEAGAIGDVMGSAIGLRQVLLNLVNNAIKFTARGLVEVQASVIELGAGEGGDKRLSLRVRDTGIGIAHADLGRVFDDFVTLDSSFGRKADGTGLGLGIARRIVQSMGGEIGVVSQPKLGSTFWIDLPYAPAQNAPVAKGDSAGVGAGRKSNLPAPPNPKRSLDLLVVEDNQINRFILREMLTAEGHRVTEAVDGLEGVNKAQARFFDLIFMDISMPTLDGIAATVRLRSGTGPCAQVPIVAVTAHALPDDRALFLASGMNAVLNKPLDRAMLGNILHELTTPPKADLAISDLPNAAPAQPPLPAAKPAAARRKAAPRTPPHKMSHTTPPKTPLRPAAQNTKAAPPSLPILRKASVDDLKTVLGASRLSGLMQRFVDEGDLVVPNSAVLLAEGKPAEAQAALHSLAGAAATFGALALQALLAQIEAELKRGNTQIAAACHDDLAALWQASRAEITVQLAGLNA